MLKKIFSHTAIYGLAPQIPKLAGIVTLPIITKYLTDIDFGVYGLITAAMGILSMVSMFGMGVILNNTFYKSPCQYKWAWRQIYGFLILWIVPYSFLVGAILYLFVPSEASQNALWIVLLNIAPILLFGPTSVLGAYFYQLSQKPLQVGIRSMFVGFLTIGLNLLFIAYYEMGYIGWFLSTSICQIVLQASYWIPLNLKYKITPIFNFKRRFIKSKLSIALPTIPHSVGGYLLNSSGKIAMGVVGIPTSNIGLYNVAATMGNYAGQIGTATGQAVSPILLQLYKQKKEKDVKKLTFILEILFLGGFFILSIWMKELFWLLINNETLQSVYPLAIILVMAYTYRPMYLGANNRLFFYEDTKVLLKVTLVAGCSSLVLNFALLPFFGYRVIAYTAFGCFMYMGYVGYYLKEFKDKSSENYYPIFWVTLTILLTISAYIIVEFNYIVKIIISLFSMLLMLYSIFKIQKKYNG